MCCSPVITSNAIQSCLSSGDNQFFAGQNRVASQEFGIPLCIPESFVSQLSSFVSHTNDDEVIFLGKTYLPRTLRFLNFTVNKVGGIYFYGIMLLDSQSNKAVGETSFSPLQEFVYGK